MGLSLEKDPQRKLAFLSSRSPARGPNLFFLRSHEETHSSGNLTLNRFYTPVFRVAG